MSDWKILKDILKRVKKNENTNQLHSFFTKKNNVEYFITTEKQLKHLGIVLYEDAVVVSKQEVKEE